MNIDKYRIIHVYIVQAGIYVTIRYFTYFYHNKNRGHEVFSTSLQYSYTARYISPSGPSYVRLTFAPTCPNLRNFILHIDINQTSI